MSRVQIEIALGVILVLITGVVLIVYGINEENRMENFALAQEAVAIEVGAAMYENNCSRCHGLQGQGVPGLCPPLNDRHFFDNRLNEVGWSGAIEDYIIATVSSGRAVSTRPDQYPGNPDPPAMPAWSEHYGGPLRDDEIRDIAAFIMNWEPTAGQVTATEVPEGDTVGQDITQELPEGDAARGESIALTQGCVACHISAPVGPAWQASDELPGIGTRAATRFTEPDYTGSAASPEQYLFESIVNPNVYLAPGFETGGMPEEYDTKLTPQDMADLIAYLLSFE